MKKIDIYWIWVCDPWDDMVLGLGSAVEIGYTCAVDAAGFG